jgi:saccharopine dehydrogenase (NADP+, L-glutamate forming)
MRVKLALEPGDRDLVVMQHRIVTENPDTRERKRHVLSLVEYGVAGGETAMSRTVGVPAAVGVHLLLSGTDRARSKRTGD